MATPKSRSDVAVVGQLAFTSPALNGGDTFLMAGVNSGDGYYYLLMYDTNANIYSWLRGGLGNLLSGLSPPTGFAYHYFKVAQNPNITWSTTLNSFFFVPFNDVNGTDQTGLEGKVMVITTDVNNVSKLTLTVPTNTEFGVKINSFDPVGIFGVGNIQVGYRYFFENSAGLIPTIPVYLDQGLISETETYGGLPFGLGNQSITASNTTNMTPFMLNWWPSNAGACNKSLSDSNQISNVAYHICDRYGALINEPSTNFWTNNCLNVDAVRGNAQVTDCAITGGYMYYLPTFNPATGCGTPWAPGDGFEDMTDTFISEVGNPYGGCFGQKSFSGCTYGSAGLAICKEMNKNDQSCEQIRSDPCPNCPNCLGSNCNEGQGCPVDCNKCTLDCTTCQTVFKTPWWVWLILIVLGVIFLWLILALFHSSSKKNTDFHEKEYSSSHSTKLST